MKAGVAAVLIGLIVIAVLFNRSDGHDASDEPWVSQAQSLASPTPTPLPTATPRPSPTPTPPPLTLAEGDRVEIPALGIDAGLLLFQVEDDGILPQPETPEDVGIYDWQTWTLYGGAPGYGNTTLAAWGDEVERGDVFAGLEALSQGDEVTLVLSGERITYGVVVKCRIDVAELDPVLAREGPERMTLLPMSPSEIRVIAIAERHPGTVPAECPVGEAI